MDNKVKIFALGGLDEEGKDCYCVDIDGDLFVIECGLRQPDKTMPGVDYVIPRLDYLFENKDRIKGYFLTHGHDDVLGALAFIYKEAPAPIYGSRVSLEMLKMFTLHVHKDPKMYDLHPVEPSSVFQVAGRTITYFHTAHNIAASSGIAISTSLGNVVFLGDFVIENAASGSYVCDMNAIGKLAEQPTLALLIESIYADRPGYTAPQYKLAPKLEDIIKNATGRVFVSIFASDLYNVNELISLAVANKKKIVCYDQSDQEILQTMQACGELSIPRDNFASLDDILRYRDQDLVILMTGFGAKIFRKMALLASGQNEDKRIKLRPTDTFVVASMSNDLTELEYTDAADELFRSGCHVQLLSKKTFLRMHASEEDIKMMASMLKPKYYIPIKGFYKSLLHNAMLALSMGLSLNHQNVFVLENGQSVILDAKGGRLFDEGIPHGDILIDGEGVGDVSEQVLADRSKLAEGVLILALTISKKTKKILAGPEVQMKGFVYAHEADLVAREVGKVFVSSVEEALAEPHFDPEQMKQAVYEKCLKTTRRCTGGKEPMILPLIVEAE